MQGTIATMATPLLADAHGQYLPRLVQHDLESFFWTTLFGLVNFSGPFQQVKDWSKVAGGSTGGQNDSANTTIVPPAWMRPGLAEYTFHDVHASRLSTLGNWEYYQGFIQPYWEDQAILSGMEKMFNIFMSRDMLTRTGQSAGRISTNLSFNQDLRHDKLITIVKEIIEGMDKNDILHMASKRMPVHDLVQKGRDRYTSLLRSRQLPPIVPDDLKNNPIISTIPTVPTVSKRHRGVDVLSLVDGSASTTPPVLEDGQCGYSTSHGASVFYSSTQGDNTRWQGMGEREFKKMANIQTIKSSGTLLLSPNPHATTPYHTFTVSGSGGSSYGLTTPAVGDATPGGVSSTPAEGDASPGGVSRSSSKRSSADRRQAEGEGEGMLPPKKRRRAKGGRKRRKEKGISGSRMGESGGHDDGGRGRLISPKAGSSR